MFGNIANVAHTVPWVEMHWNGIPLLQRSAIPQCSESISSFLELEDMANIASFIMATLGKEAYIDYIVHRVAVDEITGTHTIISQFCHSLVVLRHFFVFKTSKYGIDSLFVNDKFGNCSACSIFAPEIWNGFIVILSSLTAFY